MERVGIDIDCVLTELEPTMEFMAKHFGKKPPSIERIKSYNLSDVFGVSEEEALNFWRSEEELICRDSILSDIRYEVIKENFINVGTEIILITSRNERYREVTENWLLDNNVTYDVLIMTSGMCKKNIIEVLELDVMIDDKPDLFIAMQDDDRTQMVCVDYKYNQDVPCDLRMTRDGIIYKEDV